MDYIAVLKQDLEKGFSKSDLERLIGLPINNLSGVLKGDKKLSKKSMIKIEQWEVSNKPNPIKLEIAKKQTEKIVITDFTKPNKKIEPQKPLNSEKSNITIDTRPKTLDQLKALCPKELTGVDRGAWISENRVKYNL